MRKQEKKMEGKRVKGYIKSPLNYVGGKYKLLEQIMPLLPKGNVFVDLFGGGFNVGANIDDSIPIIYNDRCSQVSNLLKNFYTHDKNEIDRKIMEIMGDYDLVRREEITEEKLANNYMRLRQDYNNCPEWTLFYALICCSFSNQIRFNSKGGFNLPYGKRYYNKSMQENLIRFVSEIQKRKITFLNEDFRKVPIPFRASVYADPPYYNSLASYNENGGWCESDEKDLLLLLDEVKEKGSVFALSNNLKYGNPFLEKWMTKYHVYSLNVSYGNCNYHKKDKEGDKEVLILG